MSIEVIFAEAKCEVWKERFRSGECSYQEFMNALTPTPSFKKQENNNGT